MSISKPVAFGIFFSYCSPDPEFSSWEFIDHFSDSNPGENGEVLGDQNLARVDEPTPTVSLPEDSHEPFSPFNNFSDQVNDDGSGIVKLTTEQNLEKVLIKFKPQMKSNKIVAAQLWFATQIVRRNVLRTSLLNIIGSWDENQQFMLDVTEGYLCESLTRVFSCDGKSTSGGSFKLIDTLTPYLSTGKEVTYVLNRQVSVSAFRLRVPQWAPNLHIYKSQHQDEPKPNAYKEHYSICGTLAIPVFDPYTNTCVGVFETLISSTEVDYAIIDIICNLLKAVNLHANTKFLYQPRQRVLAEILKVITQVCENHELPLAQTWMPCACPGQSCSAQQLCMANAELPFYLRDSSYYPFWEASTMYHMTKGQAVAGTTFSSRGLCFCRDITRFPDHFFLVPFSKKFKLSCSLAICLGSAYAKDDIYVIQFFWPRTLQGTSLEDEQLAFSILATMTLHFDKLRMVSPIYEELEAETERIIYHKELIQSQVDEYDFTFVSNTVTEEEKSEVGMVQPMQNSSNMLKEEQKCSSSGREVFDCKAAVKARKKRCVVSKDDIFRYLNVTLKDAANKLGISKSTFKRKCKQFKIENWQHERKDKGIDAPIRKKRSTKRDLV